jgi:phosphoribosylaminoimidazole-succinocarboxamide synthase
MDGEGAMKKLWKGPVVLETHLETLGHKRRGKVRDIYDLGESLLLVATDRISAFDVVLPDGIPGKGYVLTQLPKFWFDWLWRRKDLVPHHLISTDAEEFPESCRGFLEVLSGRSMLVKKAKPLPVECIVRGYLSGSAWKEYREGGKVSKQLLPAGLMESGRLPEPIFTPSTKASEGHDINISYDEMEQMIGRDLAAEIRSASLNIYQRASAFAETQGILIADTKFEFGLDLKTDQPMLIDEILTPDSSRFWPKDGYFPGRPQPSFDKQYVRDYLDSIGWSHQPPAPRLPEEVVRQTSLKYREALERLAVGNSQ